MNNMKDIIVNVVLSTLFVTELNSNGESTNLCAYKFKSAEEAQTAKSNYALAHKEEQMFLEISVMISMIEEKDQEICQHGIYFHDNAQWNSYAIAPLSGDDDGRVSFYTHYNKKNFQEELLNTQKLLDDLQFLKFYHQLITKLYNKIVLKY